MVNHGTNTPPSAELYEAAHRITTFGSDLRQAIRALETGNVKEARRLLVTLEGQCHIASSKEAVPDGP